MRPSRSTSVPPETGSIAPSSRRIWKCMSSRPSSSCSENQSQPTAPAPRALVLHSWSNQASPVTSASRTRGSRPRCRVRCGRARHARVADVVRRVAGLVALRREAAVAVGDEGLRRPQLEVEGEAGGRVARDEPHGAAVGVQRIRPPVLEPDGERLAGRAGQPARAAREALGRGVAARRHVRDREVGEVDLVRGEAGAFGRRAGREAAAEERELEAEAAAVGRGDVAGVVPPLGLVLEVRAVVGGQHERPDLGRAGEAARGRGRGRARGVGRRRAMRGAKGGGAEGAAARARATARRDRADWREDARRRAADLLGDRRRPESSE